MNTKLITAEEWQVKYNIDRYRPTDQRTLRHTNGDYIRAIQLNAAKWGMEQAAEIATECGKSTPHLPYIVSCCESLNRAILATADKLELPKD